MSKRVLVASSLPILLLAVPPARAQGSNSVVGRISALEQASAAQAREIQSLQAQVASLWTGLSDQSGQSRALRAELQAVADRIPVEQWNTLVDCQAGQTVAAALQQARIKQVGRAYITISGICEESVTIDRDDVHLWAATPGSGLRAPAGETRVITIASARRVELARLTLLGGDRTTGIVAQDSEFHAGGLNIAAGGGIDGLNVTAWLLDCVVEGTRNQALAFWDSTVSVFNSELRNSGAQGIHARMSSIFVEDTSIHDNRLGGVFVADGSFLRLRTSNVVGNGTDVSLDLNSAGVNEGSQIGTQTVDATSVFRN